VCIAAQSIQLLSAIVELRVPEAMRDAPTGTAIQPENAPQRMPSKITAGA
jgi:hypothetical protein